MIVFWQDEQSATSWAVRGVVNAEAAKRITGRRMMGGVRGTGTERLSDDKPEAIPDLVLRMLPVVDGE
jgi:hypothetical protein